MICKLRLEFRGTWPNGDMQEWERFLLKESEIDKFEDVRFPRLEILLLDFAAWELEEDEKLVVR